MNSSPQPAVCELDLRETLRAVLRYKWRSVGLAVLAAAVTFAVSHLLPKRYTAIAHLIFLDPTALTLDQPGNPGGKLPGARGLAELGKGLATTDELLHTLQTSGKAEYELLSMSATTASRRQLTLRVTAGSPEAAFDGVNRWGEAVLGELTRMVGVDEATMLKAEAELRAAGEKLGAHQKQLRDHLSATHPETLNARLDAAHATMESLLIKLQIVDELGVELRTTRTLLEPIGESRPLPAEFVSGFATLHQRATGFGDAAAGTGQVRTVGEGLAALEQSLATLDVRRKALERELDAVETRIANLAAEIDIVQYQTEILTRERDEAGEARKTGRDQLEARREAMVYSKDLAQVLHQPSPPSEPVSPRPLVNAILAGGLILVGSVFGAVVAACWNAGEPSPASTPSRELS